MGGGGGRGRGEGEQKKIESGESLNQLLLLLLHMCSHHEGMLRRDAEALLEADAADPVEDNQAIQMRRTLRMLVGCCTTMFVIDPTPSKSSIRLSDSMEARVTSTSTAYTAKYALILKLMGGGGRRRRREEHD